MEIKNLFDPLVKEEIIARIQSLQADTQRQWGKMNVSQMLAHVQIPIDIAFGTRTTQGNWLMRLILPLFKKNLYDERPWKKGLPTDKTFITAGKEMDFETEKNNLLNLLNRFSETSIITERHPVFGTLTREQWSKATWKHLDHHLKQFNA